MLNIHVNITSGYVQYTCMKYFPLYAFALLCLVIIELQSKKAKEKRNKASRSASRACFKQTILSSCQAMRIVVEKSTRIICRKHTERNTMLPAIISPNAEHFRNEALDAI